MNQSAKDFLVSSWNKSDPEIDRRHSWKTHKITKSNFRKLENTQKNQI